MQRASKGHPHIFKEGENLSIQLKLTHQEGLRLRQQQATDIKREESKVVERTTDAETGLLTGVGVLEGRVIGGKEWKFIKGTDTNGRPTEDVQQDEDLRRVDANGKKVKLGTYTLYVTSGIRNLVIERAGKVASFNFKNSALRNQVRVKYQTLEKAGRKTRDGKDVHEWKDSGQAQYFPPNTDLGVLVGTGQRAVVDEMPT
jgi:hypothetical protein